MSGPITGPKTYRRHDTAAERLPENVRRRLERELNCSVTVVDDTGELLAALEPLLPSGWTIRGFTSQMEALASLSVDTPVAVIANDPYHYGGGWTADAAHKLVRFLDLAETFQLPVVHLVDNPGFVIGTAAEQAGTIRHGARALAAVYQASVPICAILVRKCFGVAGAAHMNQSRLRMRYAWPSADWGSLPVEGGIEAAYRAELEASEDPDALLAEIRTRLDSVRSPLRSAEAFLAEEIIDPRDTRPLLCEFANLAAPLRSIGPASVPYRP